MKRPNGKVFVGAIKRDKKGNIKKVLTPGGWVKVKIAPVEIWSTSKVKKLNYDWKLIILGASTSLIGLASIVNTYRINQLYDRVNDQNQLLINSIKTLEDLDYRLEILENTR